MLLTNLNCQHQKNPVSVTAKRPHFCWKLESEEKNIEQKKYRIRVTKDGESIWDSGVVESSDPTDIVYSGKNLESCCHYDYQVTVWDNKEACAVSEAAFFETAFLEKGEWKGSWIEPKPLPQLAVNPLELAYKEWNDTIAAMMRGENVQLRMEGEIMEDLPLEPYDPAVILRTTFDCGSTVKSARLYISAHGIYEVKINGKPVTDTLLNPGFTTYDKRIRYQVYNVDDLIGEKNAIAVTVADGWYKGKIALGRGCEYGETPGLLMRLDIRFADGSSQVIDSDENWTWSYDGPVRHADLYLGETYDARMMKGDPSQADYDASGWEKVFVKGETSALLDAQEYPGIRIFREVPAQKLWTAPNGDLLVDFGQNMAGVIRVIINGQAGELVTFEHGEQLDKAGNFFYIFNTSPSKAQRDEYICRGEGNEIYQPKFTYHGFRYVRVKGGSDWKKEQFTALAISSDNAVTGSFTCSSPELNQLYSNIYWSQRTNNVGIPTDCPTREKAGWTGDVVVYGATALHIQNMVAFYRDWLKSIRAEQTEAGIIMGTVPQIKDYVSQNQVGSLGWGDVILTLPWQIYQEFGDRSILEENYEAMGRWMDAMKAAAYELPNPYNVSYGPAPDISGLTGRRLENQHYIINSGFHFGDWIIPSVVNEQGFSDGPMSAFLTMNYADTSILAHIADLYAEISRVLGHTENAEESEAYAKRVREAFLEEYVTPDHRLGQEMQGNYILALKYHMVTGEVEKAFADRLNELITGNGFKLDTGFMSTPHLLDVLCDYGYQNTAWKVLFQENCPSWLYEVGKGATTMWESWDAVRPDGALGDCSFNHYAFGCVGDFFYRRILGIQNAANAYEQIRIEPEYEIPLTHVEGSFDSARGKISVAIDKQEGRTHLSVMTPPGTSAGIRMPGGEWVKVGNGSFEFEV